MDAHPCGRIEMGLPMETCWCCGGDLRVRKNGVVVCPDCDLVAERAVT